MILKFSEVLEIKNGKNQKKVEKIGGKYPVYGSGGVIGWADSYLCEENNVIIGRKGNINKPLFIDKPFWNVDTAFGLISKKKILNSKYLYYFCLNYNFEKLNTTVTIPSLTKNNLLNIKINVPDLKKQEKIVKILDSIKEILLKKQKQISKLNILSKCLFSSILSNEEKENYKKINELFEIIDGDRGKNYPKPNELYEEEYCLFLNTGNVTKNGFCFGKTVFITKEKDDILRNGKLRREDIVLTTRGTVGNLAYYDENIKYDNIRINSGMVILRRTKEINPIFFIYSFKETNDYIKSISGSAQPQLPIVKLKATKVLFVPIELQNKFAERIKLIEKSKFILSDALNFQCECTFLKQI